MWGGGLEVAAEVHSKVVDLLDLLDYCLLVVDLGLLDVLDLEGLLVEATTKRIGLRGRLRCRVVLWFGETRK